MVEEIARLSPSQRRMAAKYPNALPLLLTEPVGTTALFERLNHDRTELSDALTILDLISLEHGAADLRSALRTLENSGPLAIQAFRLMGPDGFALVALYGPIIDALDYSLPIDKALILLRVNADDVDKMLETHSPEFVGGAASTRGSHGPHGGRRFESAGTRAFR